MKVTDQLNRTLTLDHTPARIVSLVPSLTELLCDLGLGDSIVGVTKFCVHPIHIRKQKTVVGGTKQVKVERIKRLRPDIIIANKEENTEEIIANLNEVAPIHISDIGTIEDCLELIGSYGLIFSKQIQADNLIAKIKSKIVDFEAYISAYDKISVAYFIWKDPWMVVGRNTYIHYILTLNKFENHFFNIERYPEIDIENIRERKLDLILLSSEPYPFKEKHIMELKERFPKTKILLVDGEMFSWYGSRILKAVDYFTDLNREIR